MSKAWCDCETLGGLLTHLILVPAWVVPMVLNPIIVGAVGSGHGFMGILVSLGVLAGVYLGPDSDLARFSLIIVCWGLALSGPDEGKLLTVSAAVYSSFICWMVSGKSFSSREGFYKFMTQDYPLKGYYKQCELRGEVQQIQSGRNCIAAHPHGVLTVGYGMNLVWNSDFHERTGRINFLIDHGLRYRNPQFRLLADSYEGKDRSFAAADAASISEIMRKGESWCFLPGGFTDATVMKHGEERVAIKDKKGWIKHCLRGGYRIIPVYTFGESDTFYTFQPLLNLRLWINKFHLPGVIPFGNPLIPFLPFQNSRILTYVGKAVDLPCIKSPTDTDVNEWHAKYVKALQETFDKYKADAGKPDAVLQIW
eukprot:TRINITY_DN106005_c0_g1_i1.p1 TRINITY_DN106005_c0_g1~~TRINITY_DN106005_c0_g1_i1.p1  ORF type:complete len:383 (+),score=37.10 TRINITY_DN106005_c0_g1_i1:50-1150(+)